MTVRTIRRTISFLRPFYLKGVDRVLPPRDYDVVTDEELIEGLSVSAYRRVSTAIFVPAPSISKQRKTKTQRLTSRRPLDKFEIFWKDTTLCAPFYTPSLANSPSASALLTGFHASAPVRNCQVTRSRSLKPR
jgi:hypothetical protein